MSVLYPDVPDAPGVPPVLRSLAVLTGGDALLTLDGNGITDQSAPEWGIYQSDGATLALQPDSIVAIEYGKEEQIATFPVEQGGFQSYNKVELPFHIRVMLTKGGSIDERAAFLSACHQLRAATDLYTFVTPEDTYQNGNVTAVRLARSAQNGAQLLSVEMMVDEVRQSATSQFTKSTTADPASATSVNGGAVQPKTADLPSPAGQPL